MAWHFSILDQASTREDVFYTAFIVLFINTPPTLVDNH